MDTVKTLKAKLWKLVAEWEPRSGNQTSAPLDHKSNSRHWNVFLNFFTTWATTVIYKLNLLYPFYLLLFLFFFYCSGFLTGKVRRNEPPTEGRLGWVAGDSQKRKTQVAPDTQEFSERQWNTLSTVERIAKAKGQFLYILSSIETILKLHSGVDSLLLYFSLCLSFSLSLSLSLSISLYFAGL